MTIKRIAKWFARETVCVVGRKGTGKDVLFGNVIARRKKPYISNTDYGGEYKPLELEKLMCGGNTYKDFINDTLKPYTYPYEDETDVYIADVGVYFPSQYCNELNRDYKQIPVFEALSRHLGKANLHFNVQNLNRAWDKLREHSDLYIRCRLCKVLFGKIVIQIVTVYDKYESCVNKVAPFRLKLPLFANKEMRLMADIQRQNYRNTHGQVKTFLLVYWNKSKHDTRAFKEMLANPCKTERKVI